MKVIVTYWVDESGNPKSIERISATSADVKRFLHNRHPESRIKWFDSPADAAIDGHELKEYSTCKNGFEYLQIHLNEDSLAYCGAQIAYYDPKTNEIGHIYKYGFQIRNIH